MIFDSTAALLQRTSRPATAVLCLDVDWAPGRCYEFDLVNVFGRRSPCTAPSLPQFGGQIVRATNRVERTIDAAVCPSAAVVYAARKIVQCLEQPPS